MVSAAKGKYKSLERLRAGLSSVRSSKSAAAAKLVSLERELRALSEQKSFVKVYTADATKVQFSKKIKPEFQDLVREALSPAPAKVQDLKRRLRAQLDQGNIVALSSLLLGERDVLSSADVNDAIEAIRSVDQFKIIVGASSAPKSAEPTEVAAEPEEADRDRIQELKDQIDFLKLKIEKCTRDEKHIRAEMQIVARLGEEAAQEPAQKTSALRKPIDARITSAFGMRMHPILKEERMHKGIDFGAPFGTAVEAAAQGKVTFAGDKTGYGNIVIIEHRPGFETAYAHLSKIEVEEGAFVGRGYKVGEVGTSGLSTGPHLHFEVRVNGAQVDPTEYL